MNNLIKKFFADLLSANTPMNRVIKWCGKKYWIKENSLDIANAIYQNKGSFDWSLRMVSPFCPRAIIGTYVQAYKFPHKIS